VIVSRFLSPKLWMGSISAVAVGLLVFDDLRPRGPGPLSTVHDRHPDLDSRGDCQSCHGEGDQTMANACTECHSEIEAHIQGALGLHGTLESLVASQCALCHSDHHGGSFQLVNDRSFAIAGVSNREEFDHNLIGFDMQGGHLDVVCNQCHENANKEVLEPGEHRYLGLSSSCDSCHSDPHEGRMGRECSSCHGQESFDLLSEFDHSDIFSLRGAHATASCFDCHEPDSANSVEELASYDANPSARQCVRCHETPHSREFSTGIASMLGLLPGNSCSECHDPSDASFHELGVTLTPEQHAETGFALDHPHASLACADCHDPDAGGFEERHPGRAATECASCHEDPHAGQFATGPFSKGCLECHSDMAFDPHQFTAKEHAQTGMALTGSHLALECEACHAVDSRSGVRHFNGTAKDCSACHSDAHVGFFEKHGLEQTSSVATDCSQCHGTEAFGGKETRAFDHGQWTGFPLQGAHAQNNCSSCHTRSGTPNEDGRHLGFVHDHYGSAGGCVDCHEDPHGGRFDRPRMPKEIDGREGCARCHVETSFRLFDNGFRHAKWTGFALDGSHADLSCASCHEPLKKRTPDGRTWNRAHGRACADCHLDPHAGQFSLEGKADCSVCHEPEGDFLDLQFDHDRDTPFALDRAHEKVECSACHRSESIDGVRAVRYKPMGSECVDCHGVTKSRLRPSGGGKERK
jgi:hypothetical protein